MGGVDKKVFARDYAAIDADELAVKRGLRLSIDDMIRRDAITQLICDGVTASNLGRGYILRRLLYALPILIGVSLRTKRPASAVLMPMGFATLIGGMSTTIGTSTNLLVVSVASELGVERFAMFAFFGPVAVAGVVALLYLWLIAPRFFYHEFFFFQRRLWRRYELPLRELLRPDTPDDSAQPDLFDFDDPVPF